MPAADGIDGGDGQRPRAAVVRAAFLLLLVPTLPAFAQGAPDRGTSVRDLPRPGFETGRWRAGNTIFYPLLTLSATADDNIFATSTDEKGAAVFRIAPEIEAISEGRRLTLDSRAYLDARIHSRYSSEDRVTFGAGTRATLAAGPGTTLSGGLRYDRGAEPRSDPELSPVLQRPALFDSIEASLGAGVRGARFGIGFSPSVQKVNYLTGGVTDPDARAQLSDRDQTSFRLPVRFSWNASPRVGVFVEPYLNRRNVRNAVDRDGVDRDATTLGALAGVSLDIADRWQGQFGIGVFRANADDPTLEDFSGLSMNGNLRWSPTPRTGVSLNAFSGDVATVRSGASGRVDTRLGLRLDQEVRHNLLAFAGIGWRRTSYRGGSAEQLNSIAGDIEVEWLVTRTLGMFVRLDHENRRADDPRDRFTRTAAGIGIRLRT